MNKALEEVMYGKFTRLRDTFRYSAQPVLVRENVAEHSFWTAMISITIAYEIGHRALAPKVALRGILHDIEECVTGDLVRDMKYANPEIRKKILDLEIQFVNNLTKDMGQAGRIIRNEWSVAKDQSLAGQIVGLADALSVIAYCQREYELGNMKLHEIRESCAQLIQDKFYDGPLKDIAMEGLKYA